MKKISLLVLVSLCACAPLCFAQDEDTTLYEDKLTFKPEFGIAFDGESTYVLVEDATDFNLEEFSLEVWVRFNATHENQVFMNRGAAGRDFTFYLYDRIRFLVGSDDGYNHANGFVPPADTWVHIVGVYYPDGWKALYYNGHLVGETGEFSYMAETDHPLYIGALEPGMRHLDGEMENLRIWNRVLEEDDITELLATKPEDEDIDELKSKGLIAYWASRSMEGDVVKDLTGNGHDGVFYAHSIDESHLTFKPESGLVFDGQTVYGVVDNGEPFNVEEISVEAWVYLDPIMKSRTLGTKGIVSRSVQAEMFTLFITSHYGNRIHMSIFDYGDAQATIPPPESWLHVCATFDLSHIRLYYNGVLMDEVEAVADPAWSDWGDLPLFIGGVSDVDGFMVNEGTLFQGMMENIRIWDKALNEEEIQALLAVSPENEDIGQMTEDGLLAYYSTRSLEGETLQDLTGNGNDAMFIGTASVENWSLH